VVEDLSADLDPGDEVVHPVETADERALAAPGRADHRRDQVLVDVEAHARERETRPVVDAQVMDPEHDIVLRHGRCVAPDGGSDVDRRSVG
jgi:hypothetical protein